MRPIDRQTSPDDNGEVPADEGLVAWLVPPRPPADLTAMIVVRVGEHGPSRMHKPVSGPQGKVGWDVTLQLAGFARISDWCSNSEGQWSCRVREDPSSSSGQLSGAVT